MFRRVSGLAGLITITGLALAAGPAGAVVLLDQTTGTNTGAITSTDFSTPANDPKDAQGADDFVIPPGGPWRITSVSAAGSGGSVGVDSFSVSIFENDFGAPGPQEFFQGAIPEGTTNSVTLPVSGAPLLDPGTHWLSVQAAGPTQWAWSTLGTQQGLPGRWRNPPDGYGKGCVIFKTLADCGFGAQAHDYAFRLEGEIVSNQFSIGKLKRRPNGSRYLPGTFPGMGRVTLKDRRVASGGKRRIKSTSVTLTAGGTRKLSVIPTAATRKRLKAGKAVRVAVRITYTPTGYTSGGYTTTFRLKRNAAGGG